MEAWIKKNLKYIAIAFIFLFLIKQIQSCNRNMMISSLQRNHKEVVDSLNTVKEDMTETKNLVIDSLNDELLEKELTINNLTAELRVAGVKVDEAKRSTSERIQFLMEERDENRQLIQQYRKTIDSLNKEIQALKDLLEE